MRTQFSKIAQAAGFGLAIAFTLSCSSGGGGGGDEPSSSSIAPVSSARSSSSNVAAISSSLEPSYAYCITEYGCLTGPFTASTCTGQLSNNCPGVSSPSVASSSSLARSSSSAVSSSSMAASSSSSVAPISSSAPSNSSSSSVPPPPPSSSSSVSGIVNGSPVTYEGETYQTVVIGTQTWMARNLNYNASGSKCYGDDIANCATYGRLYNWVTAMALPSNCNSTSCSSQINAKHRGICPSGWHIPSNADWNVLMKFVNPSCSDNSSCAGAGTKLKATSEWNSSSGVPASTDSYGFAALPGGYGSSGGSFYDVGRNGCWWSATEYDAYYAYCRGMGYTDGYVYYNYDGKDDLFSVRCLQD